MNTSSEKIPGYAVGRVASSPVSLEELQAIKATAGFVKQDEVMLRKTGAILVLNAGEMVNGWRAIIGQHEYLAKWFFGSDGRPDEHYKAAVKSRFVQWVSDLCLRPFDQAWSN